MESYTETPIDGDLKPDESSPLMFLEQTYHSTIETRKLNGRKVVIKTARNRDNPRTLPQWHKEVEILRLLDVHVRLSPK